jgi:hypothetical protein
MKRDASLVRLSRDHNRGLVVAVRVQREAPTADKNGLDELREGVLSFWQTALLPHFRAECECVLTRLARKLGAADHLLARTQSDHLKLNAFMVELQDGADLEQSRLLLIAMAGLLRDHIRWEESVLFERTQTELTEPELLLLGEDLSERLPEIPAPPPWQ